MTTNHAAPHTALRLSLLLPWLILITTLGVTWLVRDHEQALTRNELRTQLDFSLRETVSRIEQRVAAYEQLLRGVQGLFTTTALGNRRALNDYVAALQIDANLSGIQVLDAAPQANAQSAWADPIRRQAMEQARDSGMASITGKLAVGTGAEKHPGFAMYLPVFTPGQPHDNVAQRRAQLIGWIYAVVNMEDFMASLYGKQAPGITLAIYDGADPTKPSARLYQTSNLNGSPIVAAPDGLQALEYMVVAGHNWTLDLGMRSNFDNHPGRDVATVIAVTGVGLSLTLALLSWFMVTGRARALRLAAEMTDELRHMAQHDPLTDLPNRAMFSHRLQDELERAKRHNGRFAVIFLDLDYFKPVNDHHGHAMGDRLLRQVARRLREAVRASDTVGRIGGDEFVVLLPELGGVDLAFTLAEKIRQSVRQPYTVDGLELCISCSLGVAVYPDDGHDELTLTQSADEAMYRAKEDGRDGVARASDNRSSIPS